MNSTYHLYTASAEPDDNLLSSGSKQFTIRASFGTGGDVIYWQVSPGADWFEFARTVVCALIAERTMLSFQLSYAKGLMEREQMRALVREHFVPPRRVPDLREKINRLVELVPEHADAELASAVFRCPVEDAERALASLLSESGHLLPPRRLGEGGL